ncbi:MgtC/SapB family protein [Persicimonas caeni]|uniref:MgtC/SapB family protein n=1 Tax=Persicimonas caeni TaxID=2292766 RepID=A0A4Y6PXC2_PERCE|nr:MgtC/SapB family protein [Persicimonas caeni]QDG52978.1 MgtC/SapB family protein [Persicimonas caeni]QED34200.1 MgtC/SapB family protein [Persicimonas caeni]
MEFATSLDWQLVQYILISLGLGAVVGLERQSHYSEESEREAIGVRTFALASLLGTVSAIGSQSGVPGMVYVTGTGYFLMIIAYLVFQYRQRDTIPGITTEVASLIVFVLGVLVPFQPLLAAALGVIVAAILSVKRYTHLLVEKLSQDEVLATMKFLLVLVVVLPVLPDQGMGPDDIYNPRELGYLVVLITGISFVGYFAIRFLGRRRGISLTGLLGGLASSTAVTLAMSHRVKNSNDDRVVRLAAVFAILMANAIMSVRVTVVVAAVNPDFVGMLLVPVIAMAVPGSMVAGYLWYKMAHAYPEGGEGVPEKAEEVGEEAERSDEQLHITNPFRIGPALKFGLIFVVIIGLVHVAKIYFGSSGTYVAALISGLAEANAISIAVARMQEAGDISATVATRGVVIAILANSFVKAAISGFVGTKKLGIYVALGLVPMLAAGTVAVLLVG